MIRKLILLGIVAMLLTTAIWAANPAEAARGGKKPTSSAVTSAIVINELNPSFGGKASFSVSPTLTNDIYSLWVANKCYQNGTLVSAEYRGVQWSGASQAAAGPFSLGSIAGWTSGGADCTAYVWSYPSSETPINGASFSYSVAP